MIAHVVKHLLNSGSKLMNVNGGTPKTFSYAPGSGIVRVVGLSCLLQDEGATDLNKFGVISALSNGVIIRWTSNGNTADLMTLVDNSDLCQAFPFDQHFGSSSVLSILSVVTPEGFGNTNNLFKGYMRFRSEIILDSSTSDSISAIVQDNLTGLNYFQIAVHYEVDL